MSPPKPTVSPTHPLGRAAMYDTSMGHVQPHGTVIDGVYQKSSGLPGSEGRNSRP